MKSYRSFFLAFAVLAAVFAGNQATAQQVLCTGVATHVLAVTDLTYHLVNTKFQFDIPNLEPMLVAKFKVGGKTPSCVVAHFSGLTRVTDNYVVFQVRIDGVPMQGHLPGFAGVADPVVWAQMDDQDEQLSDPTKIASFNFFQKINPGNHVIEVVVAAGSNIDPTNHPTVTNQVLTLQYH
jgi:hypothetical protein